MKKILITAITVIIISGFIGCSINSPEPVTTTIIEQTQNIPNEHYYFNPFTVTGTVILSVTINVTESTPVDILLLSAENFNKYKNLESFQYYTAGSAFNVISKTYSGTINEGSYYIVIDNTTNMVNGGATSSGDVNVYIKVSYTTTD